MSLEDHLQHWRQERDAILEALKFDDAKGRWRPILLRDLAKAEQHIADYKRRIASQTNHP